MTDPVSKSETDGAPKVGVLIRARRRQMKMTLQQLGDASGISVGYLSQVERDHSTPSLGTLAQISRALDVGIEFFIAAPSAEDALTRNGERQKFSVGGSSIIYERIGAEFPGSVLSSFILTIPPGYRSEVVSHEGEEILFMLEGTITLKVDTTVSTISTGDSLHFRGNSPHAWWNDSGAPAKMLSTGTLSIFHSRKIVRLPDVDSSNEVRPLTRTKTSRKKGNST
ncbi:transcriptional regulator with XRE-family HTH domain [Agrobacterium larrymoorei]|uniref:Transcriptional regulator with XRE-family HTH domain n=1 Tax=Agrobacterium larrymoorei TaxID=160699 RepID=A0AAJ2ERA2_9HYPH|nr:XRE family transcriptional regulator [Agrobacterium larrymoorei]MDR6100208.1 transcriptional regulator with XRE-family HTH domain [Agrobacterium larrymoorei]